jgi:hypothetical protein
VRQNEECIRLMQEFIRQHPGRPLRVGKTPQLRMRQSWDPVF